MRTNLIICLLFLPLLYVNAQSTSSNLKQLSSIKDHYERYVIAKEVFEKVRNSNIDSLPIVAKAIVLAPDNPSDKCNALSHHIMAEYYKSKGNYFKSLEQRLEAINLFEKYIDTDENLLAENYIEAGESSELLYMYNKSLIFYNKAIVLAIKLNDKTMLAKINSNKSFAYYGLGDFASAIRQLETALSIETEINDTIALARDYNNLGFIYIEWGRLETGIEYYKKALELNIKKNIHERTAICYNNIGMAYFQKGDYNLAESFILKALSIDKARQNQLSVAKRYNNLGLIYYEQGKIQPAIQTFLEAAKVFKKMNDEINLAKALINISDIYLAQNNSVEALKYLQQGYDISLRTNSLPLIQYNTRKMYLYYKSIENYKDALHYKELHDELSDSVYSLKSSQIIEELETKYETEKKENEILRLNNESILKETIIKQKNRQRNLMAVSILLLLIGLSVIVLILIKIRNQRKRLEVLGNVKNRLFAIISHDLRSYSSVFQDSGFVVKHYVQKENYNKLAELADNLEQSAISYNNQLDNILNWATVQLNGYNLNPEVLWPAKEISDIINYISKKDKGNTFEINIAESDQITIDRGAFSIMMRNLIVNANKFTENGIISISFQTTKNTSTICVSDSGVGMDKNTLNHLFSDNVIKSERGTKGEKGSGVGLHLVKTFVTLCGGTINAESMQGVGSTFRITFPK